MSVSSKERIMRCVDHTLLSTKATWDEIRVVCDDAQKYGVASVCIPPAFVRQAAEYLEGKVPVCTVIGFPNGYETTAAKCFEAKDALGNGAEEIDTVIHVGLVKQGRLDLVEREIRTLKEVCGDRVLKVIVETCLLTEAEKRALCHVVARAGADFIKTSTGFSTTGATFEDVALFAEEIGGVIGIKAAGGISSFEDAEKFLSLGATRLGTSRLVAILKREESSENY